MAVKDTTLTSLTPQDYINHYAGGFRILRDYGKNIFLDAKPYTLTTEFNKNQYAIEWQAGVVYKSLIDNNIGNSLDDVNFWFYDPNVKLYEYCTYIDINRAIQQAIHDCYETVDNQEQTFKEQIFLTLVNFFVQKEYGQEYNSHGIVKHESHGSISVSQDLLPYVNDMRYALYLGNKYGQEYLKYLTSIRTGFATYIPLSHYD